MANITVEEEIFNIDNIICKHIDVLSNKDREMLSQDILAQLRNLVEDVSLKIYNSVNNLNLNNHYDNKKEACKYIKTRGDLKFISEFYKYLQSSTSHYTPDDDSAERLMLRYYGYMLKIKNYLEYNYGIKVLNNLNKFPIDMDNTFYDYYREVAKVIDKIEIKKNKKLISGRYYVQKVKPFYIGRKIYYEVTLSSAIDNVSKFDRLIAFTKFEILPNYAIKVSLLDAKINVFGGNTTIKIIDNWIVSVRPCEINNMGKIFQLKLKISGQYGEYVNMMNYLTIRNYSFLELTLLPSPYYETELKKLKEQSNSYHILDLIDKIRDVIVKNQPGSNILRYLLYTMNNKVIKNQLDSKECSNLSNLYLKNGCIPFDRIPFAMSLIGHNPKGIDLLFSLEKNNYDDELLARTIKNNTESRGNLYTPILELSDSNNIEKLVNTYNSKLFSGHRGSELIIENGHIYIKSYEIDTIRIIRKLNELSDSGVSGYKNSFASWIFNEEYEINCQEKIDLLSNLFEKSKVAIVYGAAGTGKTTLIKHFSHFFSDKEKIFLANTNTAVDNLKRRIDVSESSFYTVKKFLSSYNVNISCDALIIDECSTISNSDMIKVLEKAEFKVLLLVGDTYQIESILFGNWFDIARKLVSSNSIHELTTLYRTKDKKLQLLWEKVRNGDDKIPEYMARNGYSKKLDQSILNRDDEDEIILCLNYDGLYGINNINRFLQNSNQNKKVDWGINIYKVGDPILFNDSVRFSPVIYNNLKGKIYDMTEENDRIWFDIELDKSINELDIQNVDIELIGISDNNKSIIRFYVSKYSDTDEDEEGIVDNIVPFNVSYALSIHKAQGLEYNSVKIVVTNDVDDLVSSNILYTAITRSKEKLKIYWSAETQNKILSNLNNRKSSRDLSIIKRKL